MYTRLIPTLLILSTGLAAEEVITVTAEQEPPLRLGLPAADAGATLRNLPGVDAVRMGGVGLDPVVRGQSASRLRVIADGACPQGACPNRMDPPATYAPVGAGRASLTAGGLDVRQPGAPLGVIRLEREILDFSDGSVFRAEADARYAGNGAAREAGAWLALGSEQGYARGSFHAARADDYEDGDGNAVRSAYRSAKGGGSLGWTPSAQTRLELSHDLTHERDVLYAGAGMDATYSDDATTRLRLSHAGDGLLARATLDAWASRVEHSMDNYSLRPVAVGGTRMRAPTTSDSTGVQAASSLRTGAGLLGLGLDLDDLHQDARRYSGPTDATVTTLNSVLWPDARIRRLGAWSDLSVTAGDFRIIPGLRYDLVRSEAPDSGVDPAGAAMSPDQLYTLYYGADAEARSEHLFGAALRLERDWAGDGLITLAVSRQQRAADPTERFIAGNGTPSARWVGNPDLEAETHNQVQARIGRDGGREQPRWHGEVWLDRVQDYIRRDRARRQDGVLLADQATVYHNGQALLAGVSAEGALPLTGWLEAEAAWTWAEDLDSDLPLPQIPPLSGTAALNAHHGALQGRLAMRWSARATRVDDDAATGSALDAGETPAWAVLDLSATWTPWRGAELSVDNLLDRTYAEHLNKPSAFDTTVVRVNEPGRSVWVSAGVRF